MVYAAMVENHVHHNFDATLVCLGYQLAVFFVGAEAGVYLVVVRRGIAVVAAALHVVFQYGGEPKSRHAQVGEIVQMLLDTGQVATVAGIRIVTVYFGIEHAFHLVVVRIAVGKTVGHQQVEGVRSVEPFVLAAFHGACFQLIFLYGLLLALAEGELYLAGLHIFVQVQVYQQVVVAFQFYDAAHRYAGIVHRYPCVADAFAIDHQLQLGVLHACIPEGWVNFVDVGCCIGCE